jgi:hypothetical protein
MKKEGGACRAGENSDLFVSIGKGRKESEREEKGALG